MKKASRQALRGPTISAAYIVGAAYNLLRLSKLLTVAA
jgi:hypothetical protein